MIRRLTPSVFYREAFRRNCPGVRMNREEWEELERLFRVCRDETLEAKGDKLEKKNG